VEGRAAAGWAASNHGSAVPEQVESVGNGENPRVKASIEASTGGITVAAQQEIGDRVVERRGAAVAAVMDSRRGRKARAQALTIGDRRLKWEELRAAAPIRAIRRSSDLHRGGRGPGASEVRSAALTRRQLPLPSALGQPEAWPSSVDASGRDRSAPCARAERRPASGYGAFGSCSVASIQRCTASGR
jgi:hypothetical protein